MVEKENLNTKNSFEYFSKVFGQYLAPLGHKNVLSIYSAGCSYPRLPSICIQPSREFKSELMKYAMKFFDRKMYYNLSGDETVHSLAERYGQKRSEDFTLVVVHGKCFGIDEANLTLGAMNTKGKFRLLSGLAQLYTRGKYDYGGKGVGRIRFVGWISWIFNITTELFALQERTLRMSTFFQRSLVTYAWLKDREKSLVRVNYRRNKGLRPPIKITERYDKNIKNFGEFRGELNSYAKDYAILGLRNLSETLEIVESIAKCNALFNQRDYLTEDDMRLVRIYRSYVSNPMRSNFVRVVGFLKEGRSYKDICHLLNKPYGYKSQISKYKTLAENKGILEFGIERPEWWREVESIK